jgi:hypothetical protein
VALTLLMILCDHDRIAVQGSLNAFLISEIPAGGPLAFYGCSRNDSRHAGRRILPSAKLQYKGPASVRSINCEHG